MENLYNEAKKSFLHGSTVVVCSIIDSKGSSPRKTGAMMLVDQSGRTRGSVGGGALEALCVEKALDIHRTHRGYVQEFDLASELENGSSMICGGDVTIEFTFLASCQDAEEFFGKLGVKPIRVLLFGGGHVGTELVPVLEHIGFDVWVFDNRQEFASPDRHPKAKKCILCDYENISASVEVLPEDYVAVMSHGHLYDREILLQVMKAHPAYVGCIGSRKKVAATKQFLSENGISDADLDQLHSPIGIDILGDTPEEIAISIAAELIRHRALGQ